MLYIISLCISLMNIVAMNWFRCWPQKKTTLFVVVERNFRKKYSELVILLVVLRHCVCTEKYQRKTLNEFSFHLLSSSGVLVFCCASLFRSLYLQKFQWLIATPFFVISLTKTWLQLFISCHYCCFVTYFDLCLTFLDKFPFHFTCSLGYQRYLFLANTECYYRKMLIFLRWTVIEMI